MHRFALLFGLALALGCGKKPPAPPPPDDGKPAEKSEAKAPVDEAAVWRNKQFAALKVSNQDARRAAVEELSWLVYEAQDPEVAPALVEMLKEKATNGPGRTLANQINSTREAAATALLKSGPKGEALLKEKGLAILRDGLGDPSAAVREHTAYTIAQLGAMSKPLAGDIQKLCSDKDAHVRGAAFDALRTTGVADPVALTMLLKQDDAEVVGLAAELIPLLAEVPEGAIAPLSAALANANTNVQAAAANGLAAAGPRAAPAVPLLVEAIAKYYPKEYDPKTPRVDGLEAAYWLALVRIGAAAVAPTAKLLEHTNLEVRARAARALGEIGPPAKAATDALKKALSDMTINVSAEAAVALCKLGEAQEDAVSLIKRGIDYPTGGIAAYAIEASTRMGDAGKPLVPLVLAKITDANAQTRFAVVALVGTLPPAEANKAAADVGKLATDTEPDIRRLVARTLEKLGTYAAPAADALGKALATEADADIRDNFVGALIAMGPGAKLALPALLPLVAEKKLSDTLRAKAIAAVVVADAASPDVAAALVKAAVDDELTVREAAATALGQLNPLPPNAVNTLTKMAKSDNKNAVRVAALRALTSAGARAKSGRAEVEAMTHGLQPGLVLWAKVALASVDGDVKSAAPLVRAGLSDRNAAVRGSAAEALLVIGSTNDDLPALLRLLKDGGTSTRAAAATATGRLGASAKDAVPQLTRLLDDTASEVRHAAIEALGRIGSASRPAVSKLKEQLRDPQLKAAAERALAKIEAK